MILFNCPILETKKKNAAPHAVFGEKIWREEFGGKSLGGNGFGGKFFGGKLIIINFFYFRAKRLGYSDTSPGADVMKAFNYLSLTLPMNLQVLHLESIFTMSNLCKIRLEAFLHYRRCVQKR
jgi:hypothetical protein